MRRHLPAIVLLFSSIIPNQSKAYSQKDVDCLAKNAYFEARGEGVKGMQAVIDVTLNRVESKKFGRSVCSVVHSKHQFSWTRSGNVKIQRDDPEYIIAEHLARSMLVGAHRGISKGALYYHERKINPTWSRKMRRTVRIKNHVFFVASS